MKKLKNFIPLLVILILIVITAIWRSNYSPSLTNNYFDEKVKLSNIQKKTEKVFDYVRQNLSEIVNEGGIAGAVRLTQEAFKQEAITMYQCHTLAHMIGHYSKLGISDNFSILTKIGVDFCEGGFKHGLEAEIALRGLRGGFDFRPELYNFCSQLIEASAVSDCYHGAGHEFMREKMDAKQALSLCDTLTDGPIKEVTNCYTGIFSEYTNLLGGVDGETGYELTTGPPLQLTAYPTEFCATLDNKYQVSCALELSGFKNAFHPSAEALEQSLIKCTNKEYGKTLQVACLKSVAAVSTQHALPNLSTITPPKSILTLSPDLREAYILGAGGEMSEFIKNGQNKDWQTFCNYFPQEDQAFCSQIFQKVT